MVVFYARLFGDCRIVVARDLGFVTVQDKLTFIYSIYLGNG